MKACRLIICLMFIMINTALAQTTVTTPGGTTGTVPKFTDPSTIGDSVISESNGNVGIGTTTPISTLSVQGVNANIFAFGYGISGGGFTPTIGTFAARGTPTSPLPVLTGDRLASFFNYSQYDTTPGGTHGISGASIDFFADEDYAPNRNGTDMRFATAANGSGAPRLERMRIDNDGNIGIGTATPAEKLEVNGNIKLSAGSGGVVIFPDGTVQTTAAPAAEAGFKHSRAQGCTIVVNTISCSTTVTWSSAFADANYTLVCTSQGGFTVGFSNKTSSSATIKLSFPSGGPFVNTPTGELDCIAMHD